MTFRFGDDRLPKRFWSKVSVGEDGCWLWTASLNGRGYGQYMIRPSPKPTSAHRTAYLALVGPIPTGMELDHLCRVPSCCNPAHLEAVTHSENVRRGISPAADCARKTHCDKGHSLDWVRPDGRRACRQCFLAANRVLQARYREGHREAIRAHNRAVGGRYREAHREEIRAKNREYMSEYRKRVLASKETA